jgi:Flp pilus assembly protein TadG
MLQRLRVRPRPDARRHRRARERGAVAVEAALVTPILVILLLGIIEFAFIMRDFTAVSSVVRVGARIASANAGSGPGSSCDPAPCTPANAPNFAAMAAGAIQQAGTAMPKDQIDYIMVYQANAKGFPAPSGTVSASIPANTATARPPDNGTTPCAAFANCVAYRWVDSQDAFRYTSGSWDSKSVNACPTTAYNVGVWMHATHKNITTFFGSTKGLSDHTVMKFEPLSTGQCLPNNHV